jgi:hypothetical protein
LTLCMVIERFICFFDTQIDVKRKMREDKERIEKERKDREEEEKKK